MADSPVLSSTPTSVNSPTTLPAPSPVPTASGSTSITPASNTPTVSTASITPSSSATVQPTIPVGSITSTATANLPSTQPSSGDASAHALIGGAAGAVTGLVQSQNAIQDATNQDAAGTQSKYNQDSNSITNAIQQYLGKGQEQLNMENSMGLPGLRQVAAQLNTQYTTQQLAYNAQYNAVLNNPNGTMEQKAQQISALQQQHGFELTDTAVRASLANTNFTAAQDLINHQIDIKYAPMKDAIDYGFKFLANDQALLTQKETQKFQASLQVQQQQYEQGKFYSQLNATTGMDMVKTAAANGADANTIDQMGQAIAKGASPADVAAIGGAYVSAGEYTVAFNPASGQMEPFNAKTGQFKSGGSGSPSTIINQSDPTSLNTVKAPNGQAYNFKASGYNTADPQYGVKMNAAIADITSKFGPITTAAAADAVIKQYAPTSKIAGKDIITAADSAGVDPTVLLAQVKEECLLGCSNVALKNNNYGGVSYVGQAGATKGTARPPSEGGNYAKFPTPEAGLEAQARLIAKAKVSPSATTTGQTTHTQLTADKVQSLRDSLPANISSGINYMDQAGNGYIDLSLVSDLPGAPAGFAANQAKQIAKTYGLSIVNHDQALALQDANAALTKINNMQSAWNSVAPKSGIGAYLGGIPNQAGMLFHTEHGQFVKQYQNLLPTAISTLNTITNSKRLSKFSSQVSDDSLPLLPGFTANGKADTLQEGNIKLDNLRRDINSSITSISPDLKGGPLSADINKAQTTNAAPAYTANGSTYTLGADGLYHAQ